MNNIHLKLIDNAQIKFPQHTYLLISAGFSFLQDNKSEINLKVQLYYT